MKNIKNDIPALLGLIGSASIAFITSGVVNSGLLSLLNGLGGNLAVNFLFGLSPSKIKNWFVDIHPDDMNHSVKKLFINSIGAALSNINVLYSESGATAQEKKDAAKIIRQLQRELKSDLADSTRITLEDPEIKSFLYSKSGDSAAVTAFVLDSFAEKGIPPSFGKFLSEHLAFQIQLCFGEGLKDPANRNAWIAFQRMLLEEIRESLGAIEKTQHEIKSDITQIKSRAGGLTDDQLDEIRKLNDLIGNKKLFSLTVNDSIAASMKNIEAKENELIRTTTRTDINVKELKSLTKSIDRKQNRVLRSIYSLVAVILIVLGIFSYRPIARLFNGSNPRASTNIIDAGHLDRNILLDVSLMSYSEVLKLLTDEELNRFEWSYPLFQYRDTVVNNTYSIVPQNEYYDNYYRRHYIEAPLLASWDNVSLQTHACYLDVKFVNNSAATLVLDKLIIDVLGSEPDKTPFIYACTEQAYTSKISFVNEGHSLWEGFDFEFTLLKAGESFDGNYDHGLFIPYFEDGCRIDLREYIEAEGFSYDKLMRETPAYEDGAANSDDLICLRVMPDSLSYYSKYAYPFRFVGDSYTSSIQAELVGRITFRGANPLTVDIHADIPITTTAEFGAMLECSDLYDVKLRPEGKNYSIEYPVSLSLMPNEAERIALIVTAPESSFHKLKLRIDNINGLAIESKTVNLSIFQPRTFQDLLDYMAENPREEW